MSKLEVLKNSLIKKQELLNQTITEEHSFVISKNGEPLGNNKKYNRASENFDRRIRNLEASIKKTESAIQTEEFKQRGLNSQGQIIGSVSNVELLKEKAKQAYTYSNKSYYSKKAKNLQNIKEIAEKQKNLLSDKTKELLSLGKVALWHKQPVYYFVKGFKKAGLILTINGDLHPCNRYPISKEDKIKIEEYLDISFEENLKKHKENKIKE